MKNLVTDFNLEVYLKGEIVDLCIPTENYAAESSWYTWFNNPKTTRFLEQGIFPNTASNQISFFKATSGSTERISFIISDKEKYIGTISLSSINLYKRTADIAMLIGEDSKVKNADLAALEAMAIMSEFGIKKMGLNRIFAGQHEKLFKWQRKLELLGYRIDGYKKHGFIKGSEMANSVIISLHPDDVKTISQKRGGLWDSADKMRVRTQSMPKESFTEKLKHLIVTTGEEYYREVFEL